MPAHLIAIPFGFLLRVVQVVVDASLYIIIGLLMAGALRAMVGPERLRTLFGTGRWTAPFRAWLAATTLLPVCSLGVLPVLRELRRAGVSRPAVLTFALAAPMLNPISLIYGVSYLGPNTLGVLVLGTGLVSVGIGVLWGYLRPQDLASEAASFEGQVPSIGMRRLTAAAVHAARESVGSTARDVAFGILGAGVAASLIAAPTLAATMFAGDFKAIPGMMLVAPASYITPEQAVVIVPEMLKFRQSPGAMFVLVSLGAGMTLGHLSWISKGYGLRSAILWLALAGGLTLFAAYGIDVIVPSVGTRNEDNDHFNMLANPLEYAGSFSEVRDGMIRHLSSLDTFHLVTSGTLLTLIISGVVLRRMGERGTFESFISTSSAAFDGSAEGPVSGLSRPLSPRVLSATASIGFLFVAIAGAYAYFPSPSEAFQDMQIIKADFFGELNAPSNETPLHHLDLWDRQAAKLKTGAFIRLIALNDESKRATEELREGIQSLRSAVEQHRTGDAKAVFFRIQTSFARCQASYGVNVPH